MGNEVGVCRKIVRIQKFVLVLVLFWFCFVLILFALFCFACLIACVCVCVCVCSCMLGDNTPTGGHPKNHAKKREIQNVC